MINDTPTGQIDKYGKLVRDASDTKNKPKWVKITTKIFFLVCLVIPGIFLLYTSFLGYKEGGVGNILIPLIIGLVMTIAGFVGMKSKSSTIL